MANIGRNEPCPCGSGKKYKKCCALKAYAEIKPEASIKRRQIDEILKYFRKHHVDAIEEAAEIYWDEFDPDEHLDGGLLEMAHVNFWDWVVHDAKVDYYDEEDSKTLLELYIEENGKKLADDELKVLNKMKDSYLSLYEVVEVYPEEGFLLKDLLLGGEFKVRERSATRFLSQWDIMAARILDLDGEYVLTGSIFSYARSRREGLIKAFQKDLAIFKSEHTNATMRDYLKEEGDMFNYYWYEPILYPEDMQLATTSGEPFILSKARFEIKDKDKLATALSEVEGFSREEDNSFTWLGETEKVSGPVVFGHASIEGKKLILETNSKERLEKGKELILKHAADYVTHKADEFRDINKAVEDYEAPPKDTKDEIPLEIQQQVYNQFMRQHYENWLTDKIPILDGKTPLEAVKTKDGKRRVIEVLKDIENSEERNKKSGRAFFDISWMWERLGIER